MGPFFMSWQNKIQSLIVGVQQNQKSVSGHRMSPGIPFRYGIPGKTHPETSNKIRIPLLVGHFPASG